MAEPASIIIERLAKVLDPNRTGMPRGHRDQWRVILDAWQSEIEKEAYDEGYGDRDDEGAPEFEEVDGQTLDDLKTGIDLMKNGDTLSAPVYLDRALRDFGSSYY